MADWTSTMQQTFEYYIVDPITWKDSKKINNVIASTINRELDAETLGSATIDVSEPIGECYIRVYLMTIQNGIKEKHPLGTFLVQTPSYNFDGKSTSITMDAYTSLLELKENQPPLGYSILSGQNIMDNAYEIVRGQVRAPVVPTRNSETLSVDFVANTNDTWISFVYDLLGNARYTLSIDEMGRILFNPKQDTASLRPVWTYTDDNSSILYSDVDIEHDLYGIPNVVEVIYSSSSMGRYCRVVNDDPNSPTSTVSRGREIIYRDMSPKVVGNPTDKQMREYATQLLRDLSCLEYKITYTHGYCPVRIGDCVRLQYNRAGLNGLVAKVVSQSIECVPGCSVSETAVFTTRLWG